MIYGIFTFLVVGILALKFAKKLLWEEDKIKRRKERRVAWNKKQKGTRYGKGDCKSSKPRTRKNKRH